MALASALPYSQPTPLLGRTDELETIVRRLTDEQVRLLTLVGPAGVGKTRLTLEALARLAGHVSGGVVFVDLTPVREAPLVLPAIAHALGLPDVGSRPLSTRLAEHLAGREMLLILDNFEQVLPAAVQLAELLAAAPLLRLLVTSRIPLRLRAEQTIRLLPLPVPDQNEVPSREELLQIPAVALFVERAQAQRADFHLTEEQVPLLLQLLHRLDGLPLAIELAAGQVNVLPLAVIVRRLDRRLQSLAWAAHDLPDRHHSLQAAIDWSYELLPEKEQRLFQWLGVFVGRVTLDAMAAVVGDEDDADTLAGLVSLAEKSLILPYSLDGEELEPAFGMLETVREYAKEQLAARGELQTAAGAHAAYYLALAEDVEPRLRGPEQERWLAHLETAHDNLRAALGWAREREDGELGLRLAIALKLFWEMRGHLTEGRAWLETMLDTGAAAPARLRATALDTTGWLAFNQADYGRAEALFEEALSLWRELGHGNGIAASLHALGTVADRHGDDERASALLEEALALRRELEDRDGIAMSLTNLGALAGRHGDFGRAEALFEEALALLRELGDRHWIAASLSSLGVLAYWQGDDERAEVLLQEALATARTVGSTAWFHSTVLYLGYVASRRGDGAAAAAYYGETIQLCRDSDDRYLLPYALEACGWIVRDQGDGGRAVQLYGASAAVRASTHAALAPHEATDREHKIGVLREGLGAVAFERGWVAGQRMLPGEAIDLALALLEDAEPIPVGEKSETREPAAVSPLSPREQEVLRLVSQGLTSKQIGQQIFLSHRTVDHHLTAIFNKLGVESRAQAVAVAVQRGYLT